MIPPITKTHQVLSLFNYVCKDTEEGNIDTNSMVDHWTKLIMTQFSDEQTKIEHEQLNFFKNLMSCSIPYVENKVTPKKLSLSDRIWRFINRNNLKQADLNFTQGVRLARTLAFPTKESSDLCIVPPMKNEIFSTIMCYNFSNVTVFNPNKLATSLVNAESVDLLFSTHELQCSGLRRKIIYCYWWFYIGAKLRERFEQDTGTIL